MTAFDIYSALGNVSEELLEESELPVTKAKPKGVLYMAAAAACFAVLAVGLSHTLRNEGIEEYASETYSLTAERNETVSDGETGVLLTESGDVIYYTSVQTAPVSSGETTTYYVPGQTDEAYSGSAETVEMFTEPYPYDDSTAKTPAETEPFDPSTTVAASDAESAVDEEDDVPNTERYSYLDYNGAVYSKTAETFDERDLTFLQNGELYGFSGDAHDDEEEDVGNGSWRIRRSIPCKFYKIKNVNEKYMIAALTADGNYTTFKNFGYRPDTLGSYLKDMDFSNRIKLMTTISSYTWDKNGTSTFSEYELPDIQQYTEKFLAENADAVPETDIPPVLGRYLMNCQKGSGTYTAVMICDGGGYISVGEAFFYIGEDKTESFMAYIEENGVEIRYDSNGEPYWDDSVLPE